MRGKNILLGVFLFTTLITLVVAQGNSTNIASDLQKFSDNVQCKVDFYSAVITSMNSLAPSDPLNSAFTTIQSDFSQIQTYASSQDRASLQQFKNTFESDNSAIKTAISSWRKQNVQNLTRSQKSDLLSQFNQLKTNYETCNLNSMKDFANGRINYFNNQISDYQNKISTLSAKGIDVFSLNQIISDAQAQIITPLQSAINSATTAASLNQVIKQYCLFDGCVEGTNFHLTAKFEIAKLKIAINEINSTKVSQDQINLLQSYIIQANTVLLVQVGTKVYDSAQEQALWTAIKNGQNLVKSILNSNKPTQSENTTVNLTQ